MKYPLENQDIQPGLVIGENQIPFRSFESLYTLNIPTRSSDQFLVLERKSKKNGF